MSTASLTIIFIPTSWPIDRQRIKKMQKELGELDNKSTNIRKKKYM